MLAREDARAVAHPADEVLGRIERGASAEAGVAGKLGP